VHGLVLPRGLPVAQLCGAAGTNAGRGLAAPGAEEVALVQVSSGRRRLLLACVDTLINSKLDRIAHSMSSRLSMMLGRTYMAGPMALSCRGPPRGWLP
jgi:hypothetical protein